MRELLSDPARKKAYDELEVDFNIHKALVEARIRKNMTQKQLAKKAGIAQSAVSRIESGKINSTLMSIQKLLAFTGHKIVIVPA